MDIVGIVERRECKLINDVHRLLGGVFCAFGGSDGEGSYHRY